jgi:hypothetical protein
MNQNAVTPYAIKGLVEEALAHDADVDVDNSGRSSYDLAREVLEHLANGGRIDDVVEALIDVGSKNREKPVDWWLLFLDLFEAVSRFTPRQANRLLQFFEEAPPTSSEARAYLLRFLVHTDCSVPWDKLQVHGELAVLAEAAPLVVAEALALARKFALARQILEDALRESEITATDVLEVIRTWSDLLGPSAWPFLDHLGALCAKPTARPFATTDLASAVAAFGNDMKRVPTRFPAFAHG